MRLDGDLLISHVAEAKINVILCAPFIKSNVLKRLLAVIDNTIPVEIFTRWKAEEIAAGVSDLEVYDVAASRPLTTLKLIDNLHAKLYVSDENVLVGSANLTAKALGWCDNPNLELLTSIPASDVALHRLMSALKFSRLATLEEKEALQLLVDQLPKPLLSEAADLETDLASLWVPRLAAPEKLYLAYRPESRDRLVSSSLTAADHDLAALGIAPGLSKNEFNIEVATKCAIMPAMAAILNAASNEVSDASGAELISRLTSGSAMSKDQLWRITRDWLVYFFGETLEVAPLTFVTRPKSGARPGH